MANKRELKKKIQYVCGDLAADILLASYISEEVDREQADKLLAEIAGIQDEAIARASFWFDKTPKDFENTAAYHKARTAYNKAAFAALRKDFSDKINAVVKEMNALVPSDVRKTLG